MSENQWIENLEYVFSPQSVAIVGASRKENSIGRAILKNILDFGYQGTVYPVNPNTFSVGGIRSYPSLLAIPDPIDLVVVVVPAKYVKATIQEAVQKGVKAAVIITAGFKEIGDEGAKEEAEIANIAKAVNMRLVGPNCMGVIGGHGSILNATFAPRKPLVGGIGFISQSGALGVVVLDYATQLGLGFSKFISLGNKADINGTDMIRNLGNDPNTDVILAYLESFSDPWNFSEVASATSRKKPIILVKSGRTKAGARAASSHTGALATTETALTATLNSAGVIRVSTVEELFDCAAAFSKLKLPEGSNVCVLTNAGGPGTLAVDALISQGLNLAELSQDTIEKIKPHVSPEASLANPIDLIASGDPPKFRIALQALMEDANVHSIILIFVPPMMFNAMEIAEVIEEFAVQGGKPILGVIMGKNEILGNRDEEFHFPIYNFPESAVLALRALTVYANWRKLPEEKIETLVNPDAEVRSIISKALSDETIEYLPQNQVQALLEGYGFHFPQSKIVSSKDALVKAFDEINSPVVLKMASKSITHKTDYGGVLLDIRTQTELERSWDKIITIYNKLEIVPSDQHILIQKYYTGGVEMALGVTVDQQFGPLLMIGSGGVLIEVLDDTSFGRIPISRNRARQMIRRLKGYPLLVGYRGDNPVDLPKLEETMLKLSQLVSENRDILELDINPLLALEIGEDPIVLDARIKIRK